MSDEPRATWHTDPDGAFADLQLEEPTGLTKPTVVRVPFDRIEHLYNTLRAAQLGVDPWGNL